MRRIILIGAAGFVVLAIAAVVVVVLTAGPGGPDTGTKTFIVSGTVTLRGDHGFVVGQPCTGTGADADLHDGTTVTVSAAGGATLGTGRLTGGVGTAAGTEVWCVWLFFVPDVPADPDTYLVQVARRGAHRYDTSEIHGLVDL